MLCMLPFQFYSLSADSVLEYSAKIMSKVAIGRKFILIPFMTSRKKLQWTRDLFTLIHLKNKQASLKYYLYN